MAKLVKGSGQSGQSGQKVRSVRSVRSTRSSAGQGQVKRSIKANRPTRQVGSRLLVVRDDETALGRNGDWLLVRIEGWSKEGWSSLKLYRHAVGRKNVWAFGVKAGIAARNRDAKLLVEHHPQIMDWVLGQVKVNVTRSGQRMADAGQGGGKAAAEAVDRV